MGGDVRVAKDQTTEAEPEPQWRPPMLAPDVPNRELAQWLPKLTDSVGPERAADYVTAVRQSGDPMLVSLLAQAANGGAGAAAAPPAAALPDVNTLAERIVFAIGVWETNRGGDAPAPTESSLDTAAGVKASMKSAVQATMIFAVDLINRFPALREKADPPLTKAELKEAIARCKAVDTLHAAVRKAVEKGTDVTAFLSAESGLLTPTGLSEAHVHTMFAAAELKEEIDEKRPEYMKADKKGRKKIRAEMTDADELGIDDGSLKAYIETPAKWGEHKAAWHRVAVNAMPDDVGARIESVALADEGTALAQPEYTRLVKAAVAANPKATEEEIVTSVAQRNNSREAQYGTHVWETYKRLYGAD